MSSQQLVGLAGAGLIITNLWTGPQHTALTPLWSGSGDLAAAHTVAKQVGAEVVGVGVLAVVAGTSPTASRTALAIIGCLWVLWLIRHQAAVAGGRQLSGFGSAVTGAGASILSNPFRTPGTVSPPVITGPATGSGRVPSGGGVPYTQQIPGLPPIPGYSYPK